MKINPDRDWRIVIATSLIIIAVLFILATGNYLWFLVSEPATPANNPTATSTSNAILFGRMIKVIDDRALRLEANR